jgi:hypothetical protein
VKTRTLLKGSEREKKTLAKMSFSLNSETHKEKKAHKDIVTARWRLGKR